MIKPKFVKYWYAALTHDEKLRMVDNMRTYGGGFEKALAECFIRADGTNAAKLCSAFSDVVAKWINWEKK